MRGVTLADVTHAADQLLADGERPTIDGVRRILGTGSPATVNALLKEYFQSLPARLHLPAPIATAAAELYEKVRSTALEELATQRSELEQNLRNGQDKLSQDRRDFEAERLAAQQRLADVSADLERTREQLKTTTAKLVLTEKDLAAQTTRASTAEAKFQAADQERERSNQKHTAELQRLKDQTDGNERHFLGRIEEQKAHGLRLTQDREREVSAATKHAASLETALSEAVKAQASLRSELTQAQRDLAKRQDAVAAAETALTRAQEQASKDQSTRQAELDRVRADLESQKSAAEILKRERDEAMRESGKQEGRLTALQGQLDEAKGEIQRFLKTRKES